MLHKSEKPLYKSPSRCFTTHVMPLRKNLKIKCLHAANFTHSLARAGGDELIRNGTNSCSQTHQGRCNHLYLCDAHKGYSVQRSFYSERDKNKTSNNAVSIQRTLKYIEPVVNRPSSESDNTSDRGHQWLWPAHPLGFIL